LVDLWSPVAALIFGPHPILAQGSLGRGRSVVEFLLTVIPQPSEGAMSKRPMYLQHVNIYVRNAERSKEWYEDLLGLHTYEYRPGWAAFMSADTDQSHEVALMQLGDDAPLQQKGQVGLNHMAWRLESLDDLKDFYHRIKAKGWPIAHISDHGISLGIYTRDPDGNGVEVFYELPRAEWPVDYHIFSRDKVSRGRFPGPWDAEIRADGPPVREPQPVAAQ
jgi:catechol 2,3-dioxygenase